MYQYQQYNNAYYNGEYPYWQPQPSPMGWSPQPAGQPYPQTYAYGYQYPQYPQAYQQPQWSTMNANYRNVNTNTNSHPNPRRRMPKPRPVGPRLPPFKWFQCYPYASLLYIHSASEAIEFLPGFRENILASDPVLGFDIEWKPNFVKGQTENPVALVQLASKETVVLLHIHRWNWSSSETFKALNYLKDIMEDPRIKKLGVSISEDGRKMHRDTRMDMHGCIDLSKVAHLLDAASWDKPGAIGLARLCEKYLELDLDKKKKITRSNWEAPLNEDQILYAANDAAVSLAIYASLKKLMDRASPPSVTEYEFNVIEGNYKELSLSAVIAHAQTQAQHQTTVQSVREVETPSTTIVQSYTITVQE